MFIATAPLRYDSLNSLQMKPKLQVRFHSTPAKTGTYKFPSGARHSTPISPRSVRLAESPQEIGLQKNRQGVGCEKDLFPIAWHHNGHTDTFAEGDGRTIHCNVNLSIGFANLYCFFQCESVEIFAC